MTHYLIELYSPNAHWVELPKDQRRAFIDGLKSGMSALSALGIELLTLGETDRIVAHSSEHSFLGIWRFPDAAVRDALLAGIQASGWYEYFDHINAASPVSNLEQHLEDLVSWNDI